MNVQQPVMAATEPAAPAHPELASDSMRAVTAGFEAILFKEAFAPLSKAMGFYGDAVVSAALESMTRNATVAQGVQ